MSSLGWGETGTGTHPFIVTSTHLDISERGPIRNQVNTCICVTGDGLEAEGEIIDGPVVDEDAALQYVASDQRVNALL